MNFSLEIYRLVISYLNNRADIAALCRVSRSFRYVAERALYNTLYMSANSPMTIPLCETLSTQVRVAGLVEAITIFVDEGEEDKMDDDYWSGVAGALRSTTQLRFLNVLITGNGFVSLSWILADCTFHLRSFHSVLEWDQGLIAFLSKQDLLRDLFLAHYSSNHSSPLRAGLLPSLSTLESEQLQAAASLVPHRPVTHVKTHFSRVQPHQKLIEFDRLCCSLQKSAQPILSLEISDDMPTVEFSQDLLSYIVNSFDKVVGLRYLGTLMLPVHGHEVGFSLALTVSCSQTKPTQRLVFYARLMCLPRLRHVQMDISHWRPLPQTFVALRALANELKLYCTEILSVVFVHNYERAVLRYVRGICTADGETEGSTLWREV
jgi:hypothetical protein